MINIRQIVTVVGTTFTPVVSNYSVTSNYRVYWDKVCRDNGKLPIDTQAISIEITPDQLDENIYTVLYNELKKKYTNYVDELANPTIITEPAAPVDPVAAPAEPVAAPVEPVAAPADPVAAPADPVAAPADPVAAPADPVAAPADPVAAPADPVAAPADPATV
jgi:uncharacterized membrane-anchored protein